MLDAQYKEANSRMRKVVEKLASDLAKVRTGRASVALFDGVTVDYYGTPTPINQVGTLANPEANMITIQPWDTSLLPAVEKAIFAANLGLTPNNDGAVIRIAIPPLTEERRKQYVKQAHSLGENTKTAIRNIRRDINDHLKKLEKDKDISQDSMHGGLDEVQKITDNQTKTIDQMVKDKETDILSF